jgi:cell division protein FtsI/penicillin-binding protein 2
LEQYTYDVEAVPREIDDPAHAAGLLAPMLGRDVTELTAALSDTERPWMRLREGLSSQEGHEISERALSGIQVVPRPYRFYPLGELTAYLTGFVVRGGRAFYGLEQYYASELAGVPAGRRNQFILNPERLRPAHDGSDLVLAVDRDLQMAAVGALRAAIEAHSAARGTVVVVEPRTGSILALASLPSYDPNRYPEYEDSLYRDPAVSEQYEPGSVIKPLTMAAGLEARVIALDSVYNDTGTLQILGETIHNWDGLAHGTTNMTDILVYSLNLGTVHVSRLLGPERFYATLRAFGLGERTGVDLAAEIGGALRTPDLADWTDLDLAANSYGQGLAATPLQVAVAIAALANDGWLMRPRLVEQVIDSNGIATVVPIQPVRQAVSSPTAHAVLDMMEQVIARRVTQAALPGYRLGGKTGTSEIPQPGGYDPDAIVASFVGVVPVERPRAVILVKIERPDTPNASEVAGPVFREVARTAIRVLAIPPSTEPGDE